MPDTTDQRPPVAVGHVRLSVKDVGTAARWLETAGLRPIVTMAELAVLELREELSHRSIGILDEFEYATDRGNLWVPHAISFSTWSRLAAESGLVATRLLAEKPSRHLGGMYGAVSFRTSPPPLGEAVA